MILILQYLFPLETIAVTNNKWLVLDIASGKLTTSSNNANGLHTNTITGELFHISGKTVSKFDAEGKSYLTQTWRGKEQTLPYPADFGAGRVTFDALLPSTEIAAIQAAHDVAVAYNEAIVLSGNPHGAINGFAFNTQAINGSDIVDVPDASNYSATVTLNLYADGVLRASRHITQSGVPFRLPSGRLYRTVSPEVISNVRIKAIEVAETIQGLNDA